MRWSTQWNRKRSFCIAQGFLGFSINQDTHIPLRIWGVGGEIMMKFVFWESLWKVSFILLSKPASQLSVSARGSDGGRRSLGLGAGCVMLHEGCGLVPLCLGRGRRQQRYWEDRAGRERCGACGGSRCLRWARVWQLHVTRQLRLALRTVSWLQNRRWKMCKAGGSSTVNTNTVFFPPSPPLALPNGGLRIHSLIFLTRLVLPKGVKPFQFVTHEKILQLI